MNIKKYVFVILVAVLSTTRDFGVPDILNTIEPFEISLLADFGNANLILLEQDIMSR